MDRRNTIQKELVLDAVLSMRSHVTAEDVYEYVSREHPSIGKGTVYRNLSVLAEEGKIRKIGIPDGSDRYDFMLPRHYHICCVKCGNVLDVDMDELSGILEQVRDRHGFQFVDYDILFKGICPDCQLKEKEDA